MSFKPDITAKIHTDFGADAAIAMELITESIRKTELNTDRIIRCIIFLAKGSLKELNTYIAAANADPRDVILWAEYEKNDGDDDYTHVRDFGNAPQP